MPLILKTHSNPDSRKNWTITAEVKSPKHIILRYVPDKIIADHEDLKKLIENYVLENECTPEEITLKIIERVNNELIPKWLEITFEHNGITVKVEDQQPGLKTV